MKILLAAHHSPPNYLGGVEWVTVHAAHWLKIHGHDVEIVSVEEIRSNSLGEVTSYEDEFQGILIHRLSIPASPVSERFQQSYWNQHIERWFDEYLKKSKPDIVHLHSGYLLTLCVLHAASRQGIATVLSLHDYWTVCPRINLLHPNGERCSGPEKTKCAWCLITERRRFRWSEHLFGNSIRKKMEIPQISKLVGMDVMIGQVLQRQERINAQLHQVDMIVAHGRLTIELIIKQGVSPERVLLSPNGLDTSGWQQPLQEKIPSEKIRIGYLGNLTPIKGVHVLVDAFRKINTHNKMLELRLFGDPNKVPGYGKKLLWYSGGDERVRFMGAYVNRQVPDLLREIDVLVIPSLWYEVSPLVILEGFASQTPVVVSNIPNLVDQVTDGLNGLTFEAGNVSSLTKTLQRILDEPGLLAHLTYGIRPGKSHDEQMLEWMQAYHMALEARK
jgi:glycosyltransferase involved in cell wall biosynthesis